MGAIAAVIDTAAVPRTSVVRDMLGAAPHRGSRVSAVTLGYACLGVASKEPVDARPADAWVATDGHHAAAVAGVVDNLLEVARAVGPTVPDLTARSPAELLLLVHRHAGHRTPALLRGAYAAVVTDGRELTCFRDHLGFGPLFHRSERSRAFAASEARQIVVGAGLREEADLDVVEQIFFQSYDDDTPSARKGVRRLRKSVVLTLRPGSERTSSYWDPRDLLESARPAPGELQERFDALMQQAADRMTTAATIISLSGGVDSPAIAAYATRSHERMTGAPLPALTVVYPDHPAVDEYRYTRAVADHLGMPLHVYEQQARPLDDVERWTRLLDGPVPTVSLPQYAEDYAMVRELGATTLLTGEIAEFVFDLPQYLLPHLLLTGRMRAFAHQVRARHGSGLAWNRIARSVAAPFLPVAVARARVRERRGNIPEWLDHRRVNESAARSMVRARDRWRKVQLAAFEGPGLSSEAEEVCQQVAGVVTRRPFADVDLWELFLSLPADVKFPTPQHKALVRSLLRGRVPDVVLDRTDKTLFDDSMMADIDYAALKKLLVAPPVRLRGVDYDALADRLRAEALTLPEYLWARDLAGAHAFLEQW